MRSREAARRALVHRLFDEAAERITAYVTPVLAPLTARFAQDITPLSDDHVLDVGTGNGQLAKQLAPHVRHVTGIDLSAAMLRQTGRHSTRNCTFLRADLLHLPVRPGAFSLVVASFTLNTTDPHTSLPALRRTVAPDGRLAILEWGPRDAARAVVEDTLDAFAVDAPGPDLAALRAAIATDPPLWDRYIQDTDDYAEHLEASGFVVERAEESAPVRVEISIEAFLRFTLAGTDRHAEINALPPAIRQQFTAQVTHQLEALAAPNGTLIWQPVLFRVLARRIR